MQTAANTTSTYDLFRADPWMEGQAKHLLINENEYSLW